MLGDNIKLYRNRKGVTQVQMAEALNIAQGTLAGWESGVRRPSLDLLVAVSQYLGVSMDTLLDLPSDAEMDELYSLREDVRRDPERRVLFSLAQSASVEDVRQAVAVLDAIKRTSRR